MWKPSQDIFGCVFDKILFIISTFITLCSKLRHQCIPICSGSIFIDLEVILVINSEKAIIINSEDTNLVTALWIQRLMLFSCTDTNKNSRASLLSEFAVLSINSAQLLALSRMSVITKSQPHIVTPYQYTYQLVAHELKVGILLPWVVLQSLCLASCLLYQPYCCLLCQCLALPFEAR